MVDSTENLLAFLDEHGGPLHAMLTRLTLREDVAEDLMQELFMRLSRSAGFARADSKAAYARRAAMNMAFSWRRSQRRRTVQLTDASEPAVEERSPLARLIADEDVEQILTALGSLRRSYRDAFVLRHIEQQPYESVGDHLGKTAHQARALCSKAVRQIRAALNGRPTTTLHEERSHVPRASG